MSGRPSPKGEPVKINDTTKECRQLHTVPCFTLYYNLTTNQLHIDQVYKLPTIELCYNHPMNDYDLELDDAELENYDNDIDNELDEDYDEDFDADLNDNENPEDTADSSLMSPEEAGYADGFFDAQINSDYASFGASTNLDELTDEERDDYEQAYLTSLYSNKTH